MDDSVPQSIYSIKKIDRKCRIVTQNKNGPCPILAVYNLLGLRGTLSIPDRSGISAEEMISSIGELVLSPKLTSQLDILQANIQAAFELCSSNQLLTGLDINVKFNSVSSFEFNDAISLLDILNIRLYHLWIVDQNEPSFQTINNLSYSQLVEKLFEDESIREWHDRTQCQVTEIGLIRLMETMKEGELAVLFRNNHYLTVTKQHDKLFTLVTDQGYIETSNCVWEELNYGGGGEFVNQNFLTKTQIEDNDAVLARDLAESDLQLAQQLQREEEQRVTNMQRQPRTQQRHRTPHFQDPEMERQYQEQQAIQDKRNNKCSIM